MEKNYFLENVRVYEFIHIFIISLLRSFLSFPTIIPIFLFFVKSRFLKYIYVYVQTHIYIYIKYPFPRFPKRYIVICYIDSQLMCKMAPLIGKEMTEKIFLDRYIALCKDKEFYTRKICASHFGKLCSAVGRKTLFRKLVGISLSLSLFFFLYKNSYLELIILFSNRF